MADFDNRPTSRVGRIVRAHLDALSSTWLGVGLLVAIFIYSSIGSAAPPIRQGALADWLGVELLRFEKSEMEWFNWWPFQLLVALFCASLVLATLRRIPLSLASAGVWVTHLGILVLIAASAVYFGRKVEGDALVYQSRALVSAAGMGEPAVMVIRPQAEIEVGQGEKRYHLRVGRIDPDYTLLTGPDAGRQTTAIWLNVHSTQPQREFVRVLLVGYPEYTEDVIRGPAGFQRAVRLPGGRRLVDDDLHVTLAHDPARHFYHADRPAAQGAAAVYARLSPEDEWTQFRFQDLPQYSEWVSARDEVWSSPGEAPVPLRPLDIEGAAVPAEAAAVPDVRLRITDYLPYATMDGRWVPGGAALNPLIRFRLASGEAFEAYELLARVPRRNEAALPGGGRAAFVWATSAEQRERLLNPPEPKLVVRVVSRGIEQTVDVASAHGAEPVPIDGTDYRIQLRDVIPSGLASDHPAVAVLRIMKGDVTFDRLVVAGESSGGRDVDEGFRPLSQPADADLRVEYVDPSAPGLLLVGGDDEHIDIVWSGLAGVKSRHRASPGEQVSILDRLAVQVEQVIRNARQEVRPRIVQRWQRQPLEAVGRGMSLVRVEVDDGTLVQSVWLPFNQYAFRDERWAYPGRFGHEPREVVLSDGRRLELLYSRCRDPLPSPVLLERFILETYPGGDRESDYISLIRVWADGDWSDVTVVRSNEPMRHGGLWYFQSQWDPGRQAYTVLGVGNREAIGWMLAGACISIAGMIWTFYVRPGLLRRERERRRLAGLPVASAPADGRLLSTTEAREVAHV